MKKGIEFHKVRFLGLICISCLVLSCNPSKNDSNSSSAVNANKSTPNANSDTAVLEGLIVANANFVLKQSHKPLQLVLGKSYKTKYKNLRTLYIGTNQLVMDFIEKQKLGLKGSILSVYNEIPSNDKDITIFVGIPVNKKVDCHMAGLEYFTLPEGNYHKITGNGEIGMTLDLWTASVDAIRKTGDEITYPVFEYPSDSRNAEMTTVIKQCNILIPLK